jgi:hypothetical protein
MTLCFLIIDYCTFHTETHYNRQHYMLQVNMILRTQFLLLNNLLPSHVQRCMVPYKYLLHVDKTQYHSTPAMSQKVEKELYREIEARVCQQSLMVPNFSALCWWVVAVSIPSAFFILSRRLSTRSVHIDSLSSKKLHLLFNKPQPTRQNYGFLLRTFHYPYHGTNALFR